MVLLTVIAPSRVNDLYPSSGKNIEHARTTYHKKCGNGVSTTISWISFTNTIPGIYYKWNIEQERPNERIYLTYHAACKVEF